MSFKDQWFAQMERDLNEKVARGVPFGQAYKAAAEETTHAVVQQLVDMADVERKRSKGE